MTRYSYWLNLLISLDQLGNSLTGGWSDTTISARLGYARHKHFVFSTLAALVDFAFSPVEDNHCFNAWRGTFSNVRRGNDVAMGALAFVTIPFLVPIYFVNLWRKWL